MNSIFLLVMSSAMILETTIVVGLIVYFMRKGNPINGRVYEEGLIQVKETFEQELRDLSAKYAVEYAAFKALEEYDGVEIDIKHICEETEKRALALSIKNSESAVALCEKSLSSIREQISKTQIMATSNELLNGVVTRLKEQEKFGMIHLNNAQARLNELLKVGR